MAQGNNRQTEHRDQTQGRGERRDDARGASSARPKAVFALTERNDKTYWTRIGAAFTNRDGSITVKMDALPVSGELNIRDDDAHADTRD